MWHCLTAGHISKTTLAWRVCINGLINGSHKPSFRGDKIAINVHECSITDCPSIVLFDLALIYGSLGCHICGFSFFPTWSPTKCVKPPVDRCRWNLISKVLDCYDVVLVTAVFIFRLSLRQREGYTHSPPSRCCGTGTLATL